MSSSHWNERRAITVTFAIVVLVLHVLYQNAGHLRTMAALVATTTTTTSSTRTTSSADGVNMEHERYAVVTYFDPSGGVDSNGYLYATYSIRRQMNRHGMAHIPLVVMTDGTKIDPSKLEFLEFLLKHAGGGEGGEGEEDRMGQGTENGGSRVVQFNMDDLIHMPKTHSIWSAVCNKLPAFGLTEYTKIILLDNDVLIRTNLERAWLHRYPIPPASAAATHTGTIEWNSGAMVIRPNKDLLDLLLREWVPRTRRWIKQQMVWEVPSSPPPRSSDREKAEGGAANAEEEEEEEETWSVGEDTYNSGYHDQGMLASFFTSEDTPYSIDTMASYSSVLSSRLDADDVSYFVRHRPNLIETVHFTVHKPWRGKTHSGGAFGLCLMLGEWFESVQNFTSDVVEPWIRYNEEKKQQQQQRQEGPNDDHIPDADADAAANIFFPRPLRSVYGVLGNCPTFPGWPTLAPTTEAPSRSPSSPSS